MVSCGAGVISRSSGLLQLFDWFPMKPQSAKTYSCEIIVDPKRVCHPRGARGPLFLRSVRMRESGMDEASVPRLAGYGIFRRDSSFVPSSTQEVSLSYRCLLAVASKRAELVGSSNAGWMDGCCLSPRFSAAITTRFASLHESSCLRASDPFTNCSGRPLLDLPARGSRSQLAGLQASGVM